MGFNNQYDGFGNELNDLKYLRPAIDVLFQRNAYENEYPKWNILHRFIFKIVTQNCMYIVYNIFYRKM